MTNRNQLFRIAVRKFEPFESALAKQWNSFEECHQTGLTWTPCHWTLVRCTNPYL